jgi:hypothetical protein
MQLASQPDRTAGEELAMIRILLFGLAACTALLASASAAQAAIVDVTYRGVVTYNTDLTGIFGPASGSGNLIGSAFQITYRFDTMRGSTGSSPTNNYAYGGSNYGVPTPSLGATVKVDNVSAPTITGSYIGYISGLNDPSSLFSQQFHEAFDKASANNILAESLAYSYVFNFSPTSTIPTTIDTPFTYAVQSGDDSFMSATFFTYNVNTGASTVDTVVNGNVTSITETLVGAPDRAPGTGLASLAALALAGLYARTCRA